MSNEINAIEIDIAAWLAEHPKPDWRSRFHGAAIMGLGFKAAWTDCAADVLLSAVGDLCIF